MDSETKVLYSPAIFQASSRFDASCNIFLVSNEIGVAEIDGVSNLAALMVTVRPAVFMPESTPSIPGHVTDTKAWPVSGFSKSTSLLRANSSPM